MRQLAVKLSAAGFHTLRFDYFGTGDSAGEMTDADLEGWEDDIESAMEELEHIVGAAQVALIGLRVGATLAAKVAARKVEEVNALVLWDPVIGGEEYLRSLEPQTRQNARGPNLVITGSTPAPSESVLEVHGAPLTSSMMQELLRLDLRAVIPAAPASTRILVSEQMRSHQALGSILAGRAAGPIGIDYVADVRPWMEDKFSVGAVSAKAIHLIVEFLKCAPG
jgi:pimeloyl-ACP methyl ester carboxylesterase